MTLVIDSPAWYHELPIRCMICGTPVAAKQEDYVLKLEAGLTKAQALDSMGVLTDHCRAAFEGPIVRWFNGEVGPVINGSIPVSKYTPTHRPGMGLGNQGATASSQRGTLGLKKGLGLGPSETIQLGINIASAKFDPPKEVGKPTYNPDPSFPQEVKEVGGTRTVKIRGGQTYLAR